MPEAIVIKTLLPVLALVCCMLGTAWLALAMEMHWHQVRGSNEPARTGVVRALRVMGVAGLGASLLICLHVDHASMAALVWVMELAGSALSVAFTLSWRPRWLAWLVAWAPATTPPTMASSSAKQTE